MVDFADQQGYLPKAWVNVETDSPVAGWDPRRIRGWMKLFGERATVIVAKKKLLRAAVRTIGSDGTTGNAARIAHRCTIEREQPELRARGTPEMWRDARRLAQLE